VARSCTVCVHPERDEIDAAIVGPESNRSIAGRFSLSESSLQRHAAAHVSEALARIASNRVDESNRSLLARLEALVGRVEAILDQAEQSGKVTTALSAVRELRSLLELLGKATGELKPDGAITVVNLATSPDWLELRAAILGALGPYPEAQRAVLAALSGAMISAQPPAVGASVPALGPSAEAQPSTVPDVVSAVVVDQHP
jgi:hypothetical protein